MLGFATFVTQGIPTDVTTKNVPNKTVGIENLDPTYSIDICDDQNFPVDFTYILNAGQWYQYSGTQTLYLRVTPGQSTTSVKVWINPGGSANIGGIKVSVATTVTISTELSVDIPIPNGSTMNVLALGPFAIGVSFLAVAKMTITNMGASPANVETYLASGSSAGPSQVLDSSTQTIPASDWATVPNSISHTVSGSSDNYLWLAAGGQGSSGDFTAKELSQSEEPNATTISALITSTT